jgi:hypothetical protein
MPALAHQITKLKRLVRVDNEKGRAQQGSYTPDMMDKHFGQIETWITEAISRGDHVEAEQIFNRGMALTAAFEVAGRLGNFCTGKNWRSGIPYTWSKATLHWLLTADERLLAAKGILLPLVWSKTMNNDSVKAREAAHKAYLFLVKTDGPQVRVD